LGLLWGRQNLIPSKLIIIKLAKEDFDPGLPHMIGFSGLRLYLIPLNAMISRFRIPIKHKHILASD
jgi:hypothetical protein